MVKNAKVSFERDGAIPPEKRVPVGWVAQDKEDSQWVAVEGRVHSVAVVDGDLLINIESDGSRLRGRIEEGNYPNVPALYGARVLLKGVGSSIQNDRSQVIGCELLIPGAADIVVEQAPPSDPFSETLAPIGSTRQAP